MVRCLCIFIVFLIGCNTPNKPIEERNEHVFVVKGDSTKTLLSNIKLAISPEFQDWVLFKNGTYIIFDNVDTASDVKVEAIKLMKEYGPVYIGGPAADFGVIHLNQTIGWVVSGHCYGMYTYVNPSELSTSKPTDAEIGLLGRSKRDRDGKELVVIYVSKKK